MIYIRTFQTHQEYENYRYGTDFLRPNVSHCLNNLDVHYNPYENPQSGGGGDVTA